MVRLAAKFSKDATLIILKERYRGFFLIAE
jgi:hypothetical protein